MVGPTEKGTYDRIYEQNNFEKDSFSTLTVGYEGGNALAIPDSQFVIVPIFNAEDWEDVNGRSEIEIVDFACMIIIDYSDMHDPIYGIGITVVGQFVNRALVNTDESIVAVGENSLRVIRLIK